VTEAEARCWLHGGLAGLALAVGLKDGLDGEEDRAILDHVRGMFVRSGAALQEEAKRVRIGEAQAEIAAINAAAVKGFTEGEAGEGLWFTRGELDGCAESWIATLTKGRGDGSSKEEDRFLVMTHHGDDCAHILRSATSGETRRTVFLAGQRRNPENVERLGRLVRLRDEVARLLRFENHAALKMQETMMSSVDKLQERLVALQTKLMPLAEAEIAKLVELKKAELEHTGRVADDFNTFYSWDRTYYQNLQMKKDYSIDQAKVSEYFEVNHIVLEMLRIFEGLFGMVFVPMPELDTWHRTVSPFSVWDGAMEGGGFLGYLYLDIFERPGKFSNQYHSRVQPVCRFDPVENKQLTVLFSQGYFDADGTRHFPVSALVCSYPESTHERPSLLSHRDVRIIFHELGHAIHHLLERTKYALGQSRDFGEIPSKMLEHFVWVPEVIVRLSRHVSTLPGFAAAASGENASEARSQDDSPEIKMPLELARALARSKTLNHATGLLSLMQPAIFDQAIYTPANAEQASVMDTTKIWNQTREQCLPYKDRDAKSNDVELFGQASLSLAFRGYDANYFTYVMSEVYAADLFETAFAKDPLSPEAGRKWRYEVLERGSSQPELEMLERFLGRPLKLDAIVEHIVRGRGM